MGFLDGFKSKKEKKNTNGGGNGCIITKSLLKGETDLKWIFREEGVNSMDSGWRAIGEYDTQEYIDDPDNSIVVSYDTLINIEPAVLAILDMPVGTDLEFHYDKTGRYFIDAQTGKRIE